MRHRVSGYKLSRKTGSRKALYRNLVAECIKRGKIRTTYAKAKAIQPKLEKIITLGRKGTLNDRRKAYAFLNDDMVLDELFSVISKKFEQRSSGFTRITKLGYRKGDSTHLVELSILDDLNLQSEEQPEGSDE
ncbi:MAG: 50S ribosomal protein L17 [Chloroflexi bacterium]|nr:50S ribosomal protein L17 [Chloroflexota bacterium]